MTRFFLGSSVAKDDSGGTATGVTEFGEITVAGIDFTGTVGDRVEMLLAAVIRVSGTSFWGGFGESFTDKFGAKRKKRRAVSDQVETILTPSYALKDDQWVI